MQGMHFGLIGNRSQILGLRIVSNGRGQEQSLGRHPLLCPLPWKSGAWKLRYYPRETLLSTANCWFGLLCAKTKIRRGAPLCWLLCHRPGPMKPVGCRLAAKFGVIKTEKSGTDLNNGFVYTDGKEHGFLLGKSVTICGRFSSFVPCPASGYPANFSRRSTIPASTPKVFSTGSGLVKSTPARANNSLG